MHVVVTEISIETLILRHLPKCFADRVAICSLYTLQKTFFGYFVPLCCGLMVRCNRKVTEEKMKELYQLIFKKTDDYPAIGLRRMKEQVMCDLPRKDYRIYCENMPEEQMQAYEAILP